MSAQQTRVPATIEELDGCLRDYFIALDGPPQASITLGDGSHAYVTFAIGGEAASNSALVALLWSEMRKSFPVVKNVLFWRQRPSFVEYEVNSFGEDGPTKEQVEDGAEIPPGYQFDFDSDRYRLLLGRHMIRAIKCRVWWPGLEAGNKREGDPITVAKRHRSLCSDQNVLNGASGFYMGECKHCEGARS